jgi:hypothetical protein
MSIGALEKSPTRLSFGKLNRIAEFISYLALILGVPFGLIDLHNHGIEAQRNALVEQENEHKERIEAAHNVYMTVDQRFADFVKLCMAYPRLDCYSVPRGRSLNPRLSADEKVQQKMLYTALTDVFEVAYTEYHPRAESNDEIKRIALSEWDGWDIYIRKFLKRPSFLQTWNEIKDEYDDDFVKHVDSLIASPPAVETSQAVVPRTK